jgi:hypothetical protein
MPADPKTWHICLVTALPSLWCMHCISQHAPLTTRVGAAFRNQQEAHMGAMLDAMQPSYSHFESCITISVITASAFAEVLAVTLLARDQTRCRCCLQHGTGFHQLCRCELATSIVVFRQLEPYASSVLNCMCFHCTAQPKG